MNENELRQAMRATMTTAAAPPPMSETVVLDAARHDLRRRRARLAGMGSAVAAVAVIGLAVAVVATTSTSGGAGPAGGAPSSTSSTSSTSRSDTTSSGTEPDWPSGQTDASATDGPHYETGVSLLETMVSAVPADHQVPRDLEIDEVPLDESSASWLGTVDGVEVWDYYATLPVAKGDGLGRVIVDVQTPGNELAGAGCELGNLWGWDGTCSERVVGGERVGLWTGTVEPGRTAAYRHDDGTVVWVYQSLEYYMSGRPALTALPFTDQQLVELATGPSFRLD